MPPDTPVPPLYTPAFFRAAAAHLLVAMGFWMFVLFPLYVHTLGASEGLIGVIVALEPLAAVATRPAAGAQLDRRGRRWVFRSGSLLNVAASTGYLMATDIGAILVITRLLHGVAIGALFSTFFTFAADLAPPERRTEGITVFGISGMLPSAIGPLLGEALIAACGFPAFFALALGFAALGALLAWDLGGAAPVDASARPFTTTLAHRGLWSVWAATFLFSLTLAAYTTFLALHAQARGIHPVGLFFVCYSGAAITLRLIGARLPDRVGPERVMPPALLTLAVGVGMLSQVRSLIDLAASGVLCGLGHGYAFPVLISIATTRSAEQERGTAVSMMTGLFDMGQVVGPPVLGLIAAASGYPATFGVAAVLAAAGAACSPRRRVLPTASTPAPERDRH